MKATIAFFLAAFAACAMAATASDYDEACGFDRCYAGGAATLALPQGGGPVRRLGGASARAGFYLTEFWAVEAEAAWLENVAAVSGGALWHWWGYERLDPFFTFGLRDFIERDCGPCGGAGAFWHLDDHWSLRCDASAMLGVQEGAMVYSLSLGVQRSW